MDNELMNRVLPKWPQMIVTGEKLTIEQAMEIIRRTDSFFNYQSGNNRNFIKKAIEVLEIPQDNKSNSDFKRDNGEVDFELYRKYLDSYYEKSNLWKEKWRYIYTEYVKNDWISSSFIKGAHGWCHPDGTIYYDDNVGKYPEVQEIYNEWSLLAKEFPFLKVGITLMDGEECEHNTSPIVSMKIENSVVTLIDPKLENVHKNHETPNHKESIEEILMKRFTNNSFENAISLSTLKEWHDNIFFTITNGIVETLAKQRSYLK